MVCLQKSEISDVFDKLENLEKGINENKIDEYLHLLNFCIILAHC